MTTHSLTKYLTHTLFPIIGISVLCGCKHNDQPTPPAPNPSRTILVYMVATNDLASGNGFDDSDLNEMKDYIKRQNQSGQRLLVYHASKSGVVLKEINDSTESGVDTLKVYDSSSVSLTIERMRQVISDTKSLAKADSYGMVFWSHASGWLQDGISDPYDDKMKSFGEDYSKRMNITALATALENANLDFLYFDCCYMGSVETMYELRNCAQYAVCSPAEIPADGMPYHLTLKHLFDTASPLEVALLNAAKTTFNTYNDVFQKGDCPNTIALVRLSRLKDLAEKTRTIFSKAEQTANPLYSYQRFSNNRVNYYYDFGQYVESLCVSDADISSWKHSFSDAVIYADASPWIWSSFPIEHYCGLSTYIMDNLSGSSAKNYDTLSWYNDVASILPK